jgi:hypothetical protein
MAMYSTVSERLIAALQQPTPQDCACPPPCPACGGLQCLCRPRFFPGQVLTDDDLNRLEQYVIAKGKLHNRYFHGSGVVCGMEVVCDPCSTTNVTVKPGYALSPCGEDIIVCSDASVNVCDLINQCKPRNDCDPYGAQPPADCKQGTQRFVLSICYNETPSRGVQPLMSEPCACDCGGSCGGGCGCNGSKAGCTCGSRTTAPAKLPTRTPSVYNAQCEPTLICEDFKFTATKYVPTTTNSDVSRFGVWGLIATKATQFGPLLTRLMLCYFKAQEIKSAYTSQSLGDLNASQLAAIYSEYGAALRDFAETHLTHRCDLARKLACLDMPATTNTTNSTGNHILRQAALSASDYISRIDTLNTLWLEVVRDCFCSALLPPCAGVESSDCIPLAVVTINVDTCEVIEICNWQARKFALTLPSIFYWTSFINWGAIKDAIAGLCCGTADQRLWETIFAMMEKTAAANAGAQQTVGMMEMRSAAASGTTNGTTSDTTTTTAAATSPLNTFNALVGFMQQATQADGMANLLSAAQPAAQQAADIASLRQSVDALQTKINEQAAQIEQLLRR